MTMPSIEANSAASAANLLQEYEQSKQRYGDERAVPTDDGYRARKHTYWWIPAGPRGDAYGRIVCNGPEVRSDAPRYSQWISQGRQPLPEYGAMLSGTGEFITEDWLKPFIANGGLFAKRENGEYLMHAKQIVEEKLHRKMPSLLYERPDVAAELGIQPGDPLPVYMCEFCKQFTSELQAMVDKHVRGSGPCRDSFARNGATIAAAKESAKALTAVAEGLGRTNTVPPSQIDAETLITAIKGNPELVAALREALTKEPTPARPK